METLCIAAGSSDITPITLDIAEGTLYIATETLENVAVSL